MFRIYLVVRYTLWIVVLTLIVLSHFKCNEINVIRDFVRFHKHEKKFKMIKLYLFWLIMKQIIEKCINFKTQSVKIIIFSSISFIYFILFFKLYLLSFHLIVFLLNLILYRIFIQK